MKKVLLACSCILLAVSLLVTMVTKKPDGKTGQDSEASGKIKSINGLQLFASIPEMAGKLTLGSLEQSWDGKILRVAPYYLEDLSPSGTSVFIPGSFWDVATVRKIGVDETVVDDTNFAGFTSYNKALRADDSGFYYVENLPTKRRIRLGNEKYFSWPFTSQFSPDGKRLTLANGHEITTWNTENGKCLTRIRVAGLGYGNRQAWISPDATILAVFDTNWDGSSLMSNIKLLEAKTGKKLASLPKAFRIYRMEFSPDSGVFFTEVQHNYRDGRHLRKSDKRYNLQQPDLYFWDIRTGKLLWKKAETPAMPDGEGAVLFTSDGKSFARMRFKGSKAKALAFYETRTGRLIRVVPVPASANTWQEMIFSFDSKDIWAGDNAGNIWRWHIPEQ